MCMEWAAGWPHPRCTWMPELRGRDGAQQQSVWQRDIYDRDAPGMAIMVKIVQGQPMRRGAGSRSLLRKSTRAWIRRGATPAFAHIWRACAHTLSNAITNRSAPTYGECRGGRLGAPSNPIYLKLIQLGCLRRWRQLLHRSPAKHTRGCQRDNHPTTT